LAKLVAMGLAATELEWALDTDLLKTFLEVRNTRHFGRAADNLYITQAAVSARIKLLEGLLGVTLFIRKRNNLQLTSEGERLVPHAETVLLALARAKQDVALRDADASPVHIGVRTGIWSPLLQEKLHELGLAMPDLVLHVNSLEPDSLTRMLIDRTLDMAILYEPPSLPELHCIPIGELNLRLYSSQQHESLKAVLAHNYVYLDWGGGFARFHQRRFGDQVMPVLKTNVNDLARDYLASNGGACFMPDGWQTALAREGLTVVPSSPKFVRQLNIAYHSGSARRELIEEVSQFFREIRL
jgi:LysR family transcriptional regulator, flagellar master operon regulator